MKGFALLHEDKATYGRDRVASVPIYRSNLKLKAKLNDFNLGQPRYNNQAWSTEYNNIKNQNQISHDQRHACAGTYAPVIPTHYATICIALNWVR
jgi:hypothetical protein